jgi:hypothetical protein
MSLARDLQLARRAKAAGARYSLRIVLEARRAEIPISLAFAIVEQESGFMNIFGNDRQAWRPKGGAVTKAAVAELLRRVAKGEPSNGVGLTQLTWPGFIRAANRMGGAWKPKYQLRVGFDHLAKCIQTFGLKRGLSVYNSGSPDNPKGRRYAQQVAEKAAHWHRVLT